MTGSFIPAVNTIQAQLQYSQADGSFAENRIYLLKSAAISGTDLIDTATDLAGWWSTGDGGTNNLAACTSHEVQLVAVATRDMTTQFAGTAVFNPVSGNVGTDSDAAIELGLTVATTIRTGLAGRSFRGRAFQVGIPTGVISNVSTNVVDEAYMVKLATSWASLIAAAGAFTTPVEFVIGSFFSGVDGSGKPIPRSTAVLTPVTAAGYHDLFLDFQRRRAPGHNRHH